METEWNAYTASTWIINSIYLFSALLMGGGVLLWLSYIGDSLYTYRSAFRRFNGANSPQYKKLTIGNALEKGMGGLGV